MVSCSEPSDFLSESGSQLTLHGTIAHDEDLSGIAKHGNSGILVSDEGSDIQILKFDKNSAMVASRVPLLDSGDEADWEAVSSSPDGWFFATGSHGLTKKKERRAPSRETVFRFRLDPDNRIVDVSETTLTPLLEKISVLAPAIGRSLQDGGINIEGLAFAGDRLYFGLRTPNSEEGVYVVSTPASPFFSDNPGPASLHAIPVGADLGIRALEPLSDGRILILLGGKRNSAFLTVWDPASPAHPPVPKLFPEAKNGGKAEGLLLLSEPPGSAVFAVLYDSLPRGDPRTFRIALPPR